MIDAETRRYIDLQMERLRREMRECTAGKDTGPIARAQYAVEAGIAGTAGYATTAGEAEVYGGTVGYAERAGEAEVYGGTVGYAERAGEAEVYGGTVGYAVHAGTASVYGGTVGYAVHAGEADVYGGTVYYANQAGGAGMANGVTQEVKEDILSSAGTTVQDISATVSLSGATVFLSDSTSSVIIEPANANVQISSGANGEIQIGASAVTGMPNYDAGPITYESVDSLNSYIHTFQISVWIIGDAGVGTSSDMTGYVKFFIDNTRNINLFNLSAYQNQGAFYGLSVGFCIPVPAGHQIEIIANGNATAGFFIYPATS